jgi:hypothetical protein
MICRYFWALAFVAGVSFTSAAPAAILIHETFEHPNGNLVGQTPTPGPGAVWTAHSGAGAKPIQVSGGVATVVQSTGSGEDINTAWTPALSAGQTVYAGFDLTVSGSTFNNTNFAHFNRTATTFNGRLWLAPTVPAGSGYRLAVSGDNSITDADGEAFWGSNLTPGEQYRVVVAFGFDSQDSTLWVDPTSESSTSVVATDGSFSDALIAFAFRQASDSVSTQVFDNLIVATTFDEALGATPIPEPSTVLMTLMAASALGAVAMRRRLG